MGADWLIILGTTARLLSESEIPLLALVSVCVALKVWHALIAPRIVRRRHRRQSRDLAVYLGSLTEFPRARRTTAR
jgi:hypothetical protein